MKKRSIEQRINYIYPTVSSRSAIPYAGGGLKIDWILPWDNSFHICRGCIMFLSHLDAHSISIISKKLQGKEATPKRRPRGRPKKTYNTIPDNIVNEMLVKTPASAFIQTSNGILPSSITPPEDVSSNPAHNLSLVIAKSSDLLEGINTVEEESQLYMRLMEIKNNISERKNSLRTAVNSLQHWLKKYEEVMEEIKKYA